MGEIVKHEECRLDVAVVPSWDQAVVVSNSLFAMGQNVGFWIGDWLNYIEDLFPGTWAQMLPDIGTGHEPKTMMNFKWVCARISKDDRWPTLSFSIHAEVARFDPDQQREWLEIAAEGALTVQQLREEIRGPAKEKVPKVKRLKVQCKECSAEFDIEVEI